MMINQLDIDLKIDKWWVYKIAGGIFTWLFIMLYQQAPFSWPLILGFSQILLLYFLLAITGHMLNDYFDMEHDAAANKRNMFGATKKLWHLLPLVVLPLLALGWVVVVDGFNFLFYLVTLQLVISVLYAMPPFRLKERGWLALIFTGFYERVIPYLMLFYWMKVWSDMPVFFFVYFAWAYIWECRNYLKGQLDDFEMDKQTEVNSLAVQLGAARTSLLIRNLFVFEVLLFSVFVVIALLTTRQFDVFFGLLFLLAVLSNFWLSNSEKKLVERVDEVYNKVFLVAASVVVVFMDVKYLGVLVLLHLAFFKLYWPYYHFLYYFIWHRGILAFLYPSLKGLMSALVNYPIYYFRKYVLRWSEERSRGIDKNL